MKTRLLFLLCVLCSVTGYAQYTLQPEDVVIDGFNGIVSTTAVFNRKGHKDIIIPAKIGTQEVTGIRPYAFANMGLTRVDMKEGKITNIGRAAFSKNEISEVLFSEGTVTYLDIYEEVFKDNKLTSVVFPSFTRRIGKSAFERNELTSVIFKGAGCKLEAHAFAYNQVKDVNLAPLFSLTYVPAYLFANNPVETVKLPSGIVAIGHYAFAYNNIESLDLSGYRDLNAIGIAAFYSSGKLTSLNIDTNLRVLYERAFYNSNLSSLELPYTMQFVGEECFNGSNFTDLQFNTLLRYVGQKAFGTGTANFTLPSTDEIENWINQSAGEEATAITDLSHSFRATEVSPATFTSMDDDGVVVVDGEITMAKKYFVGEAYVYNEVGPTQSTRQNVRRIGNGAFKDHAITILNLSMNLEEIGEKTFANTPMSEINFIPTYYPYLYKIEDNAFENCKLSTLTFNRDIAYIGAGAFKNNQLTSVDFESYANKLAVVNPDAFSGNSDLSSIKLPQSSAINGLTFEKWTRSGSTVTEIDDFTSGYYARGEINDYTLDEFDISIIGTKIMGLRGLFYGNITVPRQVSTGPNKWAVLSSINEGAFAGQQFTSIAFENPEDYKYIPKDAFANCGWFSEFDFSELTNLKSVGWSAFNGSRLSSVDLSENNLLLSIDQAAFSSYFISEVKLPNWLRYIGPLAFNTTNVDGGIKLPNHCEGYVLDWFSNNNWIETYVIGSHAYAYTPRYTGDLKTFTITYNTNGGTNADDNPSEYTVISPELSIKAATKEGYDFGSWYRTAEFDGFSVSRIKSGSYGDVELWAKYSAKNYDIVYHLDGGLNSGDNPDSYTIESNFELEEATKEGHVFKGWYNNSSFTGEPVTAITPGSINQIQLYAKFDIASAIDDMEQDAVHLSPNPARTHVVVHCNVQADVSIFDTTGKLMLQKQCSPSDNRMTVSSLKPGIYLVKVNGVVKKLIKQ